MQGTKEIKRRIKSVKSTNPSSRNQNFATGQGKITKAMELVAASKMKQKFQNSFAESKIPTRYGDFRILAYRVDDLDHAVLVLGNISSSPVLPVLVRIHSQCLTGDVFESKRCDCREQLTLSFEKISLAGRGIILYLNQEGRGIGLLNKIKAYSFQDQGLDTVVANECLGLPVDGRDYKVAVKILKHLKVGTINLLTNNPDKIKAFKKTGIVANRIPLEVKPNPKNYHYLLTKKRRLNHLICLQE